MKRQEIVFRAAAAMTIDGRITDSRGHFSKWGSKEDHRYLDHLIEQHDAVIFGRITYEHVVVRGTFRKPVVVLSTKAKTFSKTKGVTFLDPNEKDVLQYFRSKGYRNILILGGTQVYTYFLHKKLIQEFFVTIEPWFFSSGKTLLRSRSFDPTRFRLQEVKRLNADGTLLLHYKICTDD